jgi:hypothetical protein
LTSRLAVFAGLMRSPKLDDVFDFVVGWLTVGGKFQLAYYQPKFICEQVVEHPDASTCDRN